MRQDARNRPEVLDARHDLQPCAAMRARLDLDTEHPLEPLRPALGCLCRCSPGPGPDPQA